MKNREILLRSLLVGSAMLPCIGVPQVRAEDAKKESPKEPAASEKTEKKGSTKSSSSAEAADKKSPVDDTPENMEVIGKRIPAVEQTTAGPVQGYRALTASGSTRTETPIRQLPQSLQVVPRSLMKDQNSLSVAEAARNVSGVQAPNPLQTPAYESTFVRGFPAEQWLDGITSYYNAGNRDSLINAERIEVLKGPNAILYGGGSGAPLGGAINVVSKMPLNKEFNSYGVSFGTDRLVQPHFDFNQALSPGGQQLLRLTGEYTSGGSFIGALDTDRFALNPTLTLTSGKKTTLTLQGRLSDWKQQEYQGLPATGTIVGPLVLNRELFAGPANIPRSHSKVQSGTAQLEHKLGANWSANMQARVGKTKFREAAQNFVGAGFDFSGNTPAAGASSWSLLNIDLFQKQKETTFNGNLQANLGRGAFKSKLLFGYDHSRLTDDGVMLGDFNDLFTLGLVDLTNPVFPDYVAPANIPANTIVDGRNRYVTQGFYAQVQASLRDRLHFLGGVRRAKLRIDSTSPLLGRTDLTQATRTLPRVGAVLDLTKSLSAYASYSEGFKGNPFVLYVGTPRPEESKQKEAGLKFDFNSRFTGSLAVFDIDRSGVPIFTGLGSEAIGQQRSRGVETDLLWQPNKKWQVLANYAHADPILTAAAGLNPAGNQLNIVPRDSGRLWVNYKFNPGDRRSWSLGGGVYASSGAFVDLANTFRTAGYATMDASLRYETEKYAATLNVKNLTNEKYFVPFSYYGGRVAPGAPRGVYAQIDWKY